MGKGEEKGEEKGEGEGKSEVEGEGIVENLQTFYRSHRVQSILSK